ncbi:MAG: hypothetical protein U0W24_04135 [Bacteroidales bacterium]
MESNKDIILQTFKEKAGMKQKVFSNTYEAMQMLKDILQEFCVEYNERLKSDNEKIWLKYKDRSRFQASLKFGGDLLLFSMHSNVFQFDRDHTIWKTAYAQKMKLGTYCGIINIYNFLADSIKYNRNEDLGYLVGRIFINREKHYFVEGKRQMSSLYKDFGNAIIDKDALRTIVESSLHYILEFDLLVPPYDNVKIISVETVQEKNNTALQQTGKRLGFSFNSDDVYGDESLYTGG